MEENFEEEGEGGDIAGSESENDNAAPQRTAVPKPTSLSTTKNKSSALRKFEVFLSHFKHDFPALFINNVELGEVHITEDFIDRLRGFAQQENTWNYAKSVFQYSLNHLIKRFEGKRVFLEGNKTGWNKKIATHYQHLNRARRVPMVTHHLHVTRFDHYQICLYAFVHKLYELGGVQALDMSNGGRINEVKFLKWDDFHASIEFRDKTPWKSCLLLHWFHFKGSILTATHQMLQRKCWVTCVLHSLARLLICKSNTSELMFPDSSRSNLVHSLNQLMRNAYEAFNASRAQSPPAERTFSAMTTPQTMTQGITSHGNRGGCKDIANSILNANFQATDARLGIAGESTSEKHYRKVVFETDGRVSSILHVAYLFTL